MKNSPLISIIIPTYNRAHIIDQAIASVTMQTYTHWECIVVDDGSDDKTLEKLVYYQEENPKIKYFERLREPKGAPTCRNIGLNHVKGDFIIFLDSDDYLLPFCLEQRVNKIIEFPSCDFWVFPMGEQCKDSIIKREIPILEDYLIPFLSANLPWSIMCPIWKRDFLLKIKGFTEGYPRFNDPELMIRAMLTTNVKFKVFHDLKFDTVFIPSLKDKSIFLNKVYDSLLLFIPDVSKKLEITKNEGFKKYLVFYLHFWFRYIYTPSKNKNPKQSMNLIVLFYKKGIISSLKTIDLTLRFLLYITSFYVLKKPINKLIDKSIFN